jgi:FlaA1/EpsC-like NDP-sugar epimerase
MPEWERFLPQSYAESQPSKFAASFAGQDVLITGAGGSIGSALIKALAAERPRSLILLDLSECNLFQIQQYMESVYPAVLSQAILGSIEDPALLDDVLSRFRPDIIFHAAAFKHVSLLERNLFSAVRNNALGTHALAKAALRHGVSKLVLISTDKAAHPHSVMGVSKRIAELITVAASGPSCRMNAIRLGNVIGSSGSVVPIFLDQIAKGQSLTITHPEASRYFLSKQEAVKAILVAGMAECEGYVLLPEFRTPVLIVDLARFLIEVNMNGHNRTTPLRFTGLRPGEKLSENLVTADEANVGTIYDLLTVIKTQRLSTAESDEAVRQLTACVAGRNAPGLLKVLLSLVPEYVPSQLVLEDAALVSSR